MRTTVHDPLDFEVLGSGLGFTEGPVVTDDNTVLVVDIDSGRVLRLNGGEEPTVVATPGGGPNGMALETATTALVANNGGFLWTEVNGVRIPIDHPTHTNEPPGFAGGWIERVDLHTGEVTVLHRECDGRPLRGPNDLVLDEAGGVWFTDHGKGRRASVDRGGLYYIPPDGSTVVEKAFPLLGPNGVGLVARRPARLRRGDAHRAPVGVGPRRPRRGPPRRGIARRPPRRRVCGGHAVLVRLAGGGGRRPHRDRRDRRRDRRGHARRQRGRRAPDPGRHDHEHRVRRKPTSAEP